MQAVYVRPIGGIDRFAVMESQIQGFADQIDSAILEAAQRTGGVRHVRFVHYSSCRPIVLNVGIPASQITSHEGVKNALKALGHDRADRKYLVFYESSGCGDASGEPAGDDNVGADWATVGTDCWGWAPAAHELLHTLGAVKAGAPHATRFGHCWDDQDIMCYDDGGLPSGGLKVLCPKAHGDIIDCNNDDYFNTSPPAETYLANHWNIATDSAYLTAAGPGAYVYTGSKEVIPARAGATAYVTKFQLPDGRWTAKAKIVTNTSSPFYSSVLAVRTPAGVRYVPPPGVPRGTAAYVTVEANDYVDVKLCEGNESAKGGCTATWW